MLILPIISLAPTACTPASSYLSLPLPTSLICLSCFTVPISQSGIQKEHYVMRIKQILFLCELLKSLLLFLSVITNFCWNNWNIYFPVLWHIMARLHRKRAENSTDVDCSGIYTLVILCRYRSKLESSCVFCFVLCLKKSACNSILNFF